MAKRNRYNIVKEKINIGDTSLGWKCVALYKSFNLWTKEAKEEGYTIKECFPVNSVPNENATYEFSVK